MQIKVTLVTSELQYNVLHFCQVRVSRSLKTGQEF
jgi:hypothetical protein